MCKGNGCAKVQCLACGWICDEEDLNKDYCDNGYRGEPHETCPYCGGDDLVDGFECRCCGKFIDYGFGSHGWVVCRDCLDELIEPRTVIEFGEQHTQSVDISGLWASVYTPDEINEILMADFMKLPDAKQYEYCKEYVYEDDPSDYSDFAQDDE